MAAGPAHADTLTLAWNPNPESAVSGYFVYSGTQSGTYTRQFDSLGATNLTVPDIIAGQRYCFVVTAYTTARVEGPRSAEVCGYSNATPILVNPGSQRHQTGANVTLQLQASDAQSQPLTFSTSGLPPGLTLTPSTGFIQGRPTTAGTYQVTARATDGVLTDTETFTWTIEAPASGAPVLVNPGSQRHPIGQAVVVQLQASDPQGQAITFTASGLPPGLTISTSGRIQGTPTTAGTYQVTARASDGSLSDSEAFTWVIDAAANGAPVLVNPGSQRHPRGQSVVLQLQASDPQGQALTFTASGLPPGLTISTSGRIQGTPTTAGTYQVTARVSDGSLSDSEVFTWVIDAAANSAPVLVNPGSQRHTRGQSVVLQLQASDPQGQALTFTASGLPPGLTISTSGRIQGTPTTAGTYQVTARVSDGSLSDSEVFAWVIDAAANGAPVLVNPGSQRHPRGQSVVLQLQASDPQGQALTFTATGLPPGLTISTSGRIQGTPTTAGTYQVTARASDGSLSDSEVFTWVIDAATSGAPVLVNPGNQWDRRGQSVSLRLQASDPQGQALTFTASGLPPGLTISRSGRIQGTPATAGTYQVTARVSDGSLSDSEAFTWTIR